MKEGLGPHVKEVYYGSSENTEWLSSQPYPTWAFDKLTGLRGYSGWVINYFSMHNLQVWCPNSFWYLQL